MLHAQALCEKSQAQFSRQTEITGANWPCQLLWGSEVVMSELDLVIETIQPSVEAA
jgi:hypothetical protein